MRDLRILYDKLMLLESIKNELPCDAYEKHELVKQRIIDQKKKIRSVLKNSRASCDNSIYNPKWKYLSSSDYNTRYCKMWFPTPFDEESKQEIMSALWENIYSPYDCTGKWFTAGIAVFNVNSVNGRSIVYHIQSVDV